VSHVAWSSLLIVLFGTVCAGDCYPRAGLRLPDVIFTRSSKFFACAVPMCSVSLAAAIMLLVASSSPPHLFTLLFVVGLISKISVVVKCD
jgi:hypothetical protein